VLCDSQVKHSHGSLIVDECEVNVAFTAPGDNCIVSVQLTTPTRPGNYPIYQWFSKFHDWTTRQDLKL